MRSLAAALLAFALTIAAPAAAQTGPRVARDGLLAADRAFASQATRLQAVEGLARMLAPDVTMPTEGRLVTGRQAVIAALLRRPDLRGGAHARWRPIGGTVSADGRHGFTIGYLDLSMSGIGEQGGLRYLAYWTRRPAGWQVAAYRLVTRPAMQALNQSYAPALPAGRSRRDAAGTLRFAEQAFSDQARRVGLRVAFAEFGRPDAVHIAGRGGFNIGLPAITAALPAQVPSPVTWHSDRVIVAGSGDLGVSIGRIHPTAGGADIPFFTVWRRDPGGPWGYIAE